MQSSQSTTAAISPAGREDHVVEPVVAVDDRRRPLLGDPGRETLVDLVDGRQLAGLGLLPLTLPAPELPLDVGLLASQVAEPDLVGIDLVDRDQRVDDALADRPPLVLVELLGVLGGAQDRPLDEPHHVEGRAVHRFVLAEADDGRHRDGRVLKRGDHAVLASHVVGGAEALAERRAAERPGVPGGVADPEGEVGAPAGDPIEARAAAGPRGRSPRTSPRPRRGRSPLGRPRAVSLLPHVAGSICGRPLRLRRGPDDLRLGQLRRHTCAARGSIRTRSRTSSATIPRLWPTFAGWRPAPSPRASSRPSSASPRVCEDPEGLIDSMFAGMKPDEAMVAASGRSGARACSPV